MPTEGGKPVWLHDATSSLLASLARGLQADEEAVAAALAEAWSNGQTEEQISKLKLRERQMYGRTKLDLLRASRHGRQRQVGVTSPRALHPEDGHVLYLRERSRAPLPYPTGLC